MLSLRDRLLRALKVQLSVELELDSSPESLIELERWFFRAGRPTRLLTGDSSAQAIGFYFGEVLCRHAGFSWTVAASPFDQSRFELGVVRPGFAVMLNTGRTPRSTGNKTMRSLFREFERYVS